MQGRTEVDLQLNLIKTSKLETYKVPDNQVVACEISITDDHVGSLNDGYGTVKIIPSGRGSQAIPLKICLSARKPSRLGTVLINCLFKRKLSSEQVVCEAVPSIGDA